jgi:hypothetical protein
LAQNPLLLRFDEGRVFQGLRAARVLRDNLLWPEAFPQPTKAQVSPPRAPPMGSFMLLLPLCCKSAKPRVQPLLPQAARDWRAGGGPGAGPGALHPPPLLSLLQPCAQPAASRADRTGPSRAPRVPTHEARYRWGRRPTSSGELGGQSPTVPLPVRSGIWAAPLRREPQKRPSYPRVEPPSAPGHGFTDPPIGTPVQSLS